MNTGDNRLVFLERRIEEQGMRIDRIDERFDGIDKRFDRIDERFDRMDQRFDRLYGVLIAMLIAVVGGMGGVIAAILSR